MLKLRGNFLIVLKVAAQTSERDGAIQRNEQNQKKNNNNQLKKTWYKWSEESSQLYVSTKARDHRTTGHKTKLFNSVFDQKLIYYKMYHAHDFFSPSKTIKRKVICLKFNELNETE